MLEAKQAKKPWRIFQCDSLVTKQKSEKKLLIFVIFLFLLIVVGLIVIYHFYEEELYYVYKGPKIIVNEKTLDLSISNYLGEQVLKGTLWKSRPKDKLPYDCSEAESAAGDLCLLWKNALKLNIKNLHDQSQNTSHCYEISRTTLGWDFDQEDCFAIGDSHWFGGGLINNYNWPLEKMSFNKKPFLSGNSSRRDVFGPVLERYWLNSKGVAIIANDNSSLHISINAKLSADSNKTDGQFCLYVDSKTEDEDNFADLKYTVCVAPDIKSVHKIAMPIVLDLNVKQKLNYSAPLFDEHFLSTGPYFKSSYDQIKLLSFATNYHNKSYNCRTLLVDDGWEYHYGDVLFDSNKCNDSKGLINQLHMLNFKVSLVVHPQINTDSSSFHYATQNGLLVKDSSGSVPGLTKWISAGVAGVLDLSKNATSWQYSRLKAFQKQHSIDLYHFAGGEVSSLPAKPFFKDAMFDLNQYTQRYAKLASKFGNFVPVESAYRSQKEFILVRLTKLKSTWSSLDGLGSIIPTAFNLGLIGHRIFLPEASGGYSVPSVPNKELFVRWNQLNAFMPFMHLSIPPDYYGQDVLENWQALIELRKKLIIPELIRAYETTDVTEPIIKPIWWLSPQDPEALKCRDEFLIGDKILVAPILEEFSQYRDVYLPVGLWEDKLNDEVHVGPKLLKALFVPLKSIAYFIKK
ncbi:hypothetical protein HELRODRAFT_62459 [Helobdella robusta]|uniref:P-type domain-containing protein n=1 Tax=Helobdella robusta TaxID=6412 RepID=T1FX10_HELRO|nr:hypothetical protein HELRODRAFT_62459 [Helobdella robusta]ESO12840.1 hypothetical protein HELRODRAFT_62459 [Helobdella robusta]